MNKADIIIELSEIKSNINKARFETIDEIERIQHNVANSVDSIIIDLLDDKLIEGEWPTLESSTGCTENCPAMKKMDNLTDAIDQGYMISKEAKRPFKVGIITAYEAEKMARGGTD